MLEERYKELVADIDGIVWEADAESVRFTFVSDQAERMLGYPREQWLEPGFWARHLHPDDRDGAVEFCRAAVAAHRKHDFEYRMIAADGRTVWLRDVVSVVVERGRATKLRGIMLDVTELKRAEEERHAHLRFLESMDKINLAMQGSSDLEQMTRDVLETVLTILGCDRAWLLYPCNPEASSWNVSMELTRPEFPGIFPSDVEMPMNEEVAGLLRLVRDAHGPVCFGPGAALPLNEVSKRFGVQSMMCTAVFPKVEQPYVFGVHQCSHARRWDPEEQRLFEEIGRRLGAALTSLLVFRSLSESERKLAEAERLAHVGYWDRDLVTGHLTLSEEACQMLGLAPGEGKDDSLERERRWLEVIHPDDRERAIAAAAAARRGESRYDVEYRVVRPGGEPCTIHSRGDVTRDDAGNPCRMFGFMQDISERKDAEAQLSEMTERFRLLTESSLTGVYLIQDDIFRYVNPALASMFGYGPEEVIDKLGPNDLAYPEDRQLVAENVRRRVSGAVDEVRYELRGLCKNGTIIHVEVHGRRIEHGGKTGVMGTLIDITERRKAEEQLRLSEARFRSLVDHATDAIFLYDFDGTILDVNRQACESLGYTREELIGMFGAPFDVIVAADPSIAEGIRDRLKSGEVISFDSRHQRKDGSTFPVEIRLRPFSEGEGVFTLAIVRDITERKRTEQALLESHNLLNSVIEGTSDAIFVKDLNGRYLMINSAGAAFLGKEAGEVIGKDDTALFSADTAQKVVQHDRQVMASGQSVTAEETATAAGVTRTYLSTKGVLRDAQGSVTGLIGIARDVTDLKRLEEQFRQAQKMEAIGRLAGGVAHDFNNLLTAINGYSELASLELPQGHPVAPLLSEIRRTGERATNLTRQLLVFSRKQVLHPQIVGLNALIGDVCKLLRPLIGEDVELSFVPEPALGVVKVDPGQFEQAIINLAVNARDALPQGGRLLIETHNVELVADSVLHSEVQPGAYVQVAVSDSGVGMDPATKARIFEPFFTTKAPGKGTGLGLAMVYGFVKQSGGHIEVYSEPGHGTTFKLYLPFADGAALPAKQPAEPEKWPGGTETVLLVEDNDSLRDLAKLVLTTSGYVVLSARDGKEALRIAEDHPGTIDLLITDLIMPKIGGRQLTELLTQARPSLRVLLMSGYTNEVVLARSESDGHAFLPKPFTPNSLARKVREVLDAGQH
jgi:PAS domain S-box-containing protein